MNAPTTPLQPWQDGRKPAYKRLIACPICGNPMLPEYNLLYGEVVPHSDNCPGEVHIRATVPNGWIERWQL